jgi:hypothetical protein
MPLSPVERGLLDGIESGLRADDPALVARLGAGPEVPRQRRQTVLTHGCLWLGMCICLTGFGLVHDALTAGIVLILYGSGMLVLALVMTLQSHPPSIAIADQILP